MLKRQRILNPQILSCEVNHNDRKNAMKTSLARILLIELEHFKVVECAQAGNSLFYLFSHQILDPLQSAENRRKSVTDYGYAYITQ